MSKLDNSNLSMFSRGCINKHVCLIGLQWGDEGKGKIVDYLAKDVSAVVRFQGGGNAGHTVYVDGRKHVLHHIPTGVLQDALAILGNGMVIEPKEFIQEYDNLTEEQQSRVRISEGAHIVLPEYLEMDRLRENDKTKTKIGTTLRGIGPTYEAKYARLGRRIQDLRWKRGSMLLEELYLRIWNKIVDTTQLLYDLDADGALILFEGAQGVLLDIDFGQYPYVTSSHCTTLGVGIGTGFSPRRIGRVIGVTKVYSTRIGTGPFPSEATEEEGNWLREEGSEYGATTGRPRRCGWLDIPALKYAVKVGDVDEIALTKADILNGRKTIPVCVGYQLEDNSYKEYITDPGLLERVQPIYEEWPGWDTPYEMDEFIDTLEDATGVPVTMIGSGPNRADLIMRERCRKQRTLSGE